MPQDRPVLIAGAGIGGLSLAIALARRGLACQVLERRQDPSEAGAGIQLGPNAVSILTRLGVAERLEPTVGKPEALRVHDGSSGRLLAELPLGRWIAERHHAPYWVAHRVDLHKALREVAASLPGVKILTGCEVASFEQRDDRVSVQVADGRQFEGSVLTGADGIWSTVRRQLWPAAHLPYSGKTAARAVIPSSEAPAPFRASAVGVWLSPGGHVVHYPVRGGEEIALVAILKEPWPGEGWGLPVDRDALLGRLRIFSNELTSFLARARDWRRWPLYDPEPLAQWSRGRITLLGDAAHPVLPFLAQGGVLAIEDAEVLATALARWSADPEQALAQYEQQRRPRAGQIQAASRRNGWIYHLSGLPAFARNLTLRTAPGERIMALYDWVYGWKPSVV